MIQAHEVADVRRAEAALMATLPDGTLMQRAAAGLATACSDLLGRVYGASVVLLVGSGDNGGDALWAGARLARRGALVHAVPVRAGRMHEAGAAALRAAGGRIVGPDRAEPLLARADLVVDGMLGIGGRGGLDPTAAALADAARHGPGRVVAVDLPSGVVPDTGQTPGAHVTAEVTVTFGTVKVALLVDPAAAAAGSVRLVDIGLGPHLPAPRLEALEPADVARLLPRPGRDSNKYSRGVVGILAGSRTYAGAAVLAVGAAVRAGAGMVRYVGTDVAAGGVRSRWPEAIVSAGVESTGRVQAWVVGSGLGDHRDDEAAAALSAAAEAQLPVLVDADALRGIPAPVEGPALLTPHEGELARMLGVDRADVHARRLHHARAAADRWQATILLKGATTLVVTPDGRMRVNPTGTPALATAGTGDVLAGLAGSLLAAGLDPFDAGSVAAYVHGVAARRAAARERYPTATSVLEELPAALLTAAFPDGAGQLPESRA